nr:hypothetical protein [Tanacetum cinerariifolium]
MGHFARECRAPRSQDRGRRESYKQGSKEEELAPKALMAIDGIGWDWSYMTNKEENHALVADDEAPTEFGHMAKSSSSSKKEAFPLPVIEISLAEEVPTVSEESCHCQKKREATAVKIALLVIKFGDSYVVPASAASAETTDTTSDMQKRKNDVKARTTLMLSLSDEHQLRFNEEESLKQQYGNFKPEGTKTLEQKFNRLQRNRSDLDTMSLDDLYNHLKVYESEVQKKSKPNPHNMAFISLAKHSRGNEDVTTASVSTSSTNVPTASTNVGVASISQDTAYAYITSQSSGSKIKFEDINQIDEVDIEEMDIKRNMALLSIRANKFWKKTRKKISIQGTNMVGFDKSKVKCFNCHKMGHFAREYRAPRSQDRGRRHNYKQGSKVEEQAPKALMAIDGVGWDWSYMTNDEENHALDAEKEAPIDFSLMTNTSAESKDMSWTGLPEFKDDTLTDYSRPAPTVESSTDDAQNRSPSVTKTEASPSTISPKSFIKFVKANDCPTTNKTDKAE